MNWICRREGREGRKGEGKGRQRWMDGKRDKKV